MAFDFTPLIGDVLQAGGSYLTGTNAAKQQKEAAKYAAQQQAAAATQIAALQAAADTSKKNMDIDLAKYALEHDPNAKAKKFAIYGLVGVVVLIGAVFAFKMVKK